MAAVNVFGTEYTKSNVTTPSVNVPATSTAGRKRIIYDLYEAVAVEAASTITFGSEQVPTGARITNFQVQHDAMGAAGTFTVAVGNADPRTAASASMASALIQLGDLLGEVLTAPAYIVMTTAAATISGTIEVFLEYVID